MRRDRLLAGPAFVAGLVAILACRPAWSPDSQTVFFPYFPETNQVALGAYQLATGQVQTLLTLPDRSLSITNTDYLLPLTADGRTIHVMAYAEKGGLQSGMTARYLWLNRQGQVLAQQAVPEAFELPPHMGAWLDGGRFLWYGNTRLNLRTFKVDKPFGRQEVILFFGPTGQAYYVEELSKERVAFGRAELYPRRLSELTRIHTKPMNLNALTVSRDRAVLAFEHEDQERKLRTLVVLGLGGERLATMDLAAALPDWEVPMEGMDVFGRGDSIWLLATPRPSPEEGAPQSIYLLQYRWRAKECRPIKLGDYRGKVEGAFTMQMSPNGRYLAIVSNVKPAAAPPVAGEADLVVVDLQASPPAVQSVSVERGAMPKP